MELHMSELWNNSVIHGGMYYGMLCFQYFYPSLAWEDWSEDQFCSERVSIRLQSSRNSCSLTKLSPVTSNRAFFFTHTRGGPNALSHQNKERYLLCDISLPGQAGVEIH